MTDPAGHVGRQEVSRDYSDRGRMMRLAALLDHDSPPWRGGVVPPLGHWLCFTPLERQSRIGADGHPVRTDRGLLPNADLPRRMWVGSRIAFLGDLSLDVPIATCTVRPVSATVWSAIAICTGERTVTASGPSTSSICSVRPATMLAMAGESAFAISGTQSSG